MNEAWILQASEIRRPFSRATCVSLRASVDDEKGKMTEVGHVGDVFACGTVAFPNKHRELAERLGWSDVGIGHQFFMSPDRASVSVLYDVAAAVPEPASVALVGVGLLSAGLTRHRNASA